MHPDAIIHRIGSVSVAGLRPKPAELAVTPPGISVLVGGTPAEAVAQMRAVYPRSKKWMTATTVGTATVDQVRAAGFEVIADPTPNFPNHARIVHPLGAAGFTDQNRASLAGVLAETVI